MLLSSVSSVARQCVKCCKPVCQVLQHYNWSQGVDGLDGRNGVRGAPGDRGPTGNTGIDGPPGSFVSKKTKIFTHKMHLCREKMEMLVSVGPLALKAPQGRGECGDAMAREGSPGTMGTRGSLERREPLGCRVFLGGPEQSVEMGLMEPRGNRVLSV